MICPAGSHHGWCSSNRGFSNCRGKAPGQRSTDRGYQLKEEERRGIAENLAEEELAIFDLLTRPELKLTQKDEQQVKRVAEELLQTLKKERLVLDWRKKQQARAAVQVCIADTLIQLPPAYTSDLYHEKCELTYQHVYDSYFGLGSSVYESRGGSGSA